MSHSTLILSLFYRHINDSLFVIRLLRMFSKLGKEFFWSKPIPPNQVFIFLLSYPTYPPALFTFFSPSCPFLPLSLSPIQPIPRYLVTSYQSKLSFHYPSLSCLLLSRPFHATTPLTTSFTFHPPSYRKPLLQPQRETFLVVGHSRKFWIVVGRKGS